MIIFPFLLLIQFNKIKIFWNFIEKNSNFQFFTSFSQNCSYSCLPSLFLVLIAGLLNETRPYKCSPLCTAITVVANIKRTRVFSFSSDSTNSVVFILNLLSFSLCIRTDTLHPHSDPWKSIQIIAVLIIVRQHCFSV